MSEKKEITDNNNNVVPYHDKNTIYRKEVPCHLNYQHKVPHVTSILSLIHSILASEEGMIFTIVFDPIIFFNI